MRYPSDHKLLTRQKLVQASARLAKSSGFAASGVDALARAAGLTSGAFYKHFEGKDQLLAAICETDLEPTAARFAGLNAGSKEQVLHAVDVYLSLAHVRNPQAGCLLPALASEVGRADEATRAAFEASFARLMTLVSEKVGDRTLAMSVVTQCAGAVSVARALASEAAQREVLAAARAAIGRLLA